MKAIKKMQPRECAQTDTYTNACTDANRFYNVQDIEDTVQTFRPTARFRSLDQFANSNRYFELLFVAIDAISLGFFHRLVSEV